MKAEYPNATIHNFILDNFTHTLGLNLESLEPKKAWSYDGSDQGENWAYIFRYPGAMTVLELSLHWPGEHVFVTFTNGAQWFSFNDYLGYIGKKNELDDIFARRKTNKEHLYAENAAIEVLQLFLKYLLSDLLKVARGEEWKVIPIDWTGVK